MKRKIEITNMSDNKKEVVYSLEDMYDHLMDEYNATDIVIGEMLDIYSITGLSVVETVEVWTTLLKKYEGDTFVQIYGGHGEDELFDLLQEGEGNGDLNII